MNLRIVRLRTCATVSWSVVMCFAFPWIVSLGMVGRCQAAVPTLETIADVTLLSGSALHIPLLGSDADGHALSFSATSSNALVTPFIPQGNRSMRITSSGFGEMVFELFEGRASRVTEQIIELASSGDYNGVSFHRVLNNFVIQGGDITNGDGTGGSRLGDFDDQFHVDLQHNRTGILSMAKSGDDTNDSQFFITEGTTRHLDFNHSIFGQLIEGESVRQAISNVPTGAGGVPITDVLMDSVEIFSDIENGVLMLSAPEGTNGSAQITVTATDGVSSFDRVFNVTITPDTDNGGPFIKDLDSPIFVIEQGVASTLQLDAVDVEGDAVFFDHNSSQVPAGSTATIDSGTGLVTFTPAANYTGTFNYLVGVRPATSSDTSDLWDTQVFSVLVLPDDLAADFDSDGDVDGQDFLTLQQGLGTGTTQSEGDATGDGVVDEFDLAAWEFLVQPETLAADFDSDGDVDGQDFLTWQRGLGTGTTQPQGDANGDGVVDDIDLAVWESLFGQQAAGVAATILSVPEPSTLAMAIVMTLFAGRYRRRTSG